MHTLAIDIETYSSYDLNKSGVYKYVEAPDFEILLFAYSVDGDDVQIVDFVNFEDLPGGIMRALTDASVLKTAFNANFEITALSKYFKRKLDNRQWECAMVKSAMLGLPMGLDQVSKVLKLEQGKDAKGKALIKYFSVPCKPSKANGGRTRNMPEHAPEKWQQFKDYCVQDVVVEQSIRNKLDFFPIPETEKKLWQLDQRINDRGVLLDPVFVQNAIKLDNTYRQKLTQEITELTNLDNPNSPAQLKEWLSDETGSEVTSLTKEAVPLLLEKTDSETVTRALEIRQEMSKTSVKKYEAMTKCICGDQRARGLIQFYGASRTGRDSGRLIQVQNLPQNHLPDLDLARKLVREGNLFLLEMLFGNVPDTLSQLIRTAIIAPKGHRLIVADYSSIELIVAAWLADERWVIEEYKGERKIYEQTAARMMNIPVSQVVKGSPERQKGKIASLACQYGGGVGALVQMGALRMGLVEDELPDIIAKWRRANKKIVSYWALVEQSAMDAVLNGGPVKIRPGITFRMVKGALFIFLPSGRPLVYQKARVRPGKFGRDVIYFEGMQQTTKQWCTQDTYSGKIFENLCQAIARDCLMHGLIALEERGFKTLLRVHDEYVLEVPNGVSSVEEVVSIISQPISWAKGLPLTADGYETKYYKKD